MKKLILLFVSVVVMGAWACEENDDWENSIDAGLVTQALTESPDCIRYVDQEAEPGGDGLSWDTAMLSAEEAVEALSEEAEVDEGCEVWVKGEVTERPFDVIAETLENKKNVDIYSGFNGNETARSTFAKGLFSLANQKNSPAPAQFPEMDYDVGRTTIKPVNPLVACGACTGTGHVGRLELDTYNDAKPSQGTGYLEIGNALRIDNNEIITNANTTLYLQNDNNGKLRVDNNTFVVQSAFNNVGIGTAAPNTAAKLHINSGGSGGITTLRLSQTYGQDSLWEMRAYDDIPGSSGSNYFTIWGGDPDEGHPDYDPQDRILIRRNGKVGIGISNPSDVTHELSVCGTIRAEEIIVDTGWCDYVFEDEYDLMSLEDVEEYIDENRHLPGIPTAREIEENGVSIGESQAQLLRKIEELTLHLIEQNKLNTKISKKIEVLEEEIGNLRKF